MADGEFGVLIRTINIAGSRSCEGCKNVQAGGGALQ
jgi:hypothetical protein